MKLEIPFPCSEDIDQMNPSGSGRFCGACDKVIIDFTKMSLPEIQSYFLSHKDEKTCGIFKQETIIAQEYSIPLEIIQQNYNRWKNLFILAFAVAFGFLTFGCGEEKKVDQKSLTGMLTPPPVIINSGPMLNYDPIIVDSLNTKNEKKSKNTETISITTVGSLVMPPIIKPLDSSLFIDKVKEEIEMGIPIYIPDTIKKPILKGKTRIIGDTILTNPIIDTTIKCDPKGLIIKGKKQTKSQKIITGFIPISKD